MNVAVTDARGGDRRIGARRSGRRLHAVSLPMSPPAAARPETPWWLWPHLLSLDAPLVALVWQRWWARSAGVALPLSREIILGLGVWLIYLADRLADTSDGGRMGGAARHVFSARRRRVLLPLALAVALILAVTVLSALPTAEFLAGLGILAAALGHLCLTHVWPGRGLAAFVPKEAVVGAVFSAGSVFFVACRSPRLAGNCWLGVLLFAGVCFLNCALITRWESHAEDLLERSSLLNAFPKLSARLGLCCALLAGLSLGAWSVVAVPIALSALLLGLLHSYKNSLPVDALRVLADLVLLTPCLPIWT